MQIRYSDIYSHPYETITGTDVELIITEQEAVRITELLGRLLSKNTTHERKLGLHEGNEPDFFTITILP